LNWLAAHPEARAADLMELLEDPAIQGIVSIIGGDDSIRMLPFLDYSVIR
jgi:muramoyltetrapeptide carboxypeptidase LdcA involved in peptidoglycan recycling